MAESWNEEKELKFLAKRLEEFRKHGELTGYYNSDIIESIVNQIEFLEEA